MSKVPRDQIDDQRVKKKRISDDKFAYRTVIIATVFGIIFYAISLLFNIEILKFYVNGNEIFSIIDFLIKVAAPLLFFLFMMISIGNFKELTGKPLDWKELILLFILSVGQTLLDILVFSFTFIGLIIILAYFYLVQEI
ncbi:MAG: hypothetical protein ACW96S_05015 [Promethearchaeota archaeon]|jgi:hypothetical protein